MGIKTHMGYNQEAYGAECAALASCSVARPRASPAGIDGASRHSPTFTVTALFGVSLRAGSFSSHCCRENVSLPS